MSEQHKATLEQANAAITRGDHEGFLAHCTDDIQWTTVGGSTLDGKAAVREWMADAYAKPPTFSVHRLIADVDHVVAIGELTMPNADGVAVTRPYCDVWRLRDGRFAELQAFVV